MTTVEDAVKFIQRINPNDAAEMTVREMVDEWFEYALWAGHGESDILSDGKGNFVQALQYPGKETSYNLYDDSMSRRIHTTTYSGNVYLWLGI